MTLQEQLNSFLWSYKIDTKYEEKKNTKNLIRILNFFKITSTAR